MRWNSQLSLLIENFNADSNAALLDCRQTQSVTFKASNVIAFKIHILGCVIITSHEYFKLSSKRRPSASHI